MLEGKKPRCRLGASHADEQPGTLFGYPSLLLHIKILSALREECKPCFGKTDADG
jgi:hypothetical protein